MTQIDTHLLGSRDGYTTFACSSAVTGGERTDLEELVYGQPDGPEMLAALSTRATVLCRRLSSSSRIALTRILPGSPDSAGRATIAACTLLLSGDQYRRIARGGMWSLLHHPSIWTIAQFKSAETIAIPEGTAERHLVTAEDVNLFDAWADVRGKTNAVALVGCDIAADKAVISVVAVLDPADVLHLNWGCGLLSIPSGVALASTARSGIERQSRRTILRPTSAPTTEPGSRALQVVGTGARLPPMTPPPPAKKPITQPIPWKDPSTDYESLPLSRSVGGAGYRPVKSAESDTHFFGEFQLERGPKVWLWIAVTVLLLCTLLLGAWLWWSPAVVEETNQTVSTPGAKGAPLAIEPKTVNPNDASAPPPSNSPKTADPAPSPSASTPTATGDATKQQSTP